MESVRISIYKTLDDYKSCSIRQDLPEASMDAYFGILEYNIAYTLLLELENYYIL